MMDHSPLLAVTQRQRDLSKPSFRQCRSGCAFTVRPKNSIAEAGSQSSADSDQVQCRGSASKAAHCYHGAHCSANLSSDPTSRSRQRTLSRAARSSICRPRCREAQVQRRKDSVSPPTFEGQSPQFQAIAAMDFEGRTLALRSFRERQPSKV